MRLPDTEKGGDLGDLLAALLEFADGVDDVSRGLVGGLLQVLQRVVELLRGLRELRLSLRGTLVGLRE
jgi:hypothetical protein